VYELGFNPGLGAWGQGACKDIVGEVEEIDSSVI
jgi:hypothetical protein